MKQMILPALSAALLFSGCQSYQMQSRPQTNFAHQTEDQLIAQETQRRMSGRIESLEMEIARISQEVDALRMAAENRFISLERKTEDDKREMVDRLTAQLDKLIAQATPAAPAPRAAPSSNAYGYEHVVQSGETLSAIAKAYNVTSKVVIEANKIKNPNSLSVGQKLFIPE